MLTELQQNTPDTLSIKAGEHLLKTPHYCSEISSFSGSQSTFIKATFSFDGVGSIEWYAYDPYGKRTVMNAGFGVLSSSTIGQEYGYTGRQHDAGGTGLMYFRARYYDAQLGRFVGRDPYDGSDDLAGKAPTEYAKLGLPFYYDYGAYGVNYWKFELRILEILRMIDERISSLIKFSDFDFVRSYINNLQLKRLKFLTYEVSFVAGSSYTSGMNLYRGYFVVNEVDPQGEDPITLCLIGGALITITYFTAPAIPKVVEGYGNALQGGSTFGTGLQTANPNLTQQGASQFANGAHQMTAAAASAIPNTTMTAAVPTSVGEAVTAAATTAASSYTPAQSH